PAGGCGRDATRRWDRRSRPRSGGRAQQQWFMLDVLVGGPQALVFAEPVVDPGALAPLALIDRALQAAQIGEAAFGVGALVGDQPYAAHAPVDLTATVHADTTARPVPQLLGTRHRAGVGRHRQGALGAHAAAEQLTFDHTLREGEDAIERRRPHQGA